MNTNNTAISETEIVNKRQLASLFGVSTNTVGNWIEHGLPYVQRPTRGGGSYTFSVPAVRAWRQKHASARQTALATDSVKQQATVIANVFANTIMSRLEEELLDIADRVSVVVSLESDPRKCRAIIARELTTTLRAITLKYRPRVTGS